MRLRVLFFARSREVVGSSEIELDVDEGCTTTQLAEVLTGQYPGLGDVMATSVFAVNQEYVDKAGGGVALREGDEVAVIPPISGG